jgi:hypothetical protein
VKDHQLHHHPDDYGDLEMGDVLLRDAEFKPQKKGGKPRQNEYRQMDHSFPPARAPEEMAEREPDGM